MTETRRSKEEMTALATGDYDAIPWLDLHYEDWLWLQHFWEREKLGLEEGEPLAVAIEALDRITRLVLNGSGGDAYWLARMALDKLSLWPKDDERMSICPNCGYPKTVHEAFSPPRCPVIRLHFPREGDPPPTSSETTE